MSYKILALPHNLLICDYVLGHTSSVHDSTAFQATQTYKEHATIFFPGEFIFADSAYPSETCCMAPLKKPACGELSPDQ